MRFSASCCAARVTPAVRPLRPSCSLEGRNFVFPSKCQQGRLLRLAAVSLSLSERRGREAEEEEEGRTNTACTWMTTHARTHTVGNPSPKALLGLKCQFHEAELIHCTFLESPHLLSPSALLQKPASPLFPPPTNVSFLPWPHPPPLISF